ncbi:HlyD family secretion protein [Oligoflexus tunisiensis]|uniref:HlyD family secretion protein n=1 Tax=Oligoflexus tunisiensis TaxID=708132 RepID=UPI00114CE6CA|nr:HlyD family efflux transporter periplasmic adaptor subunit [Oligoflexus tunisiensis]
MESNPDLSPPGEVPEEGSDEEYDLFRKEVLAEQGNKLIGDVVILWRPRFQTIVAFYGLVAIAGILVLLFGSYQRKERATGILLPKQGLTTVSSEVSGSIVELMVKEGDWVEEGQPLLTISRESFLRNNKGRLREQETELQGRIAQLEAQRNQLKKKSQLETEELFNQIHDHDQSRTQVEQILLSKQRQKAEADKTFEAARRLYQQKVISRSEYESHLATVTGIDEAIAEETRRKFSFIHASREKKLQLEKLKESFASQLSKLDEEDTEIRIRLIDINSEESMVVKAFSPGYVSGLIVHSGQTVQSGQVLFTLVPGNADLEVHLFVSSQAAPFIRNGQDVWLQMEAFPPAKYGTFRAKVQTVSRVPIHPKDLSNMTLEEPRFLVKAELIGKAETILKKVDQSAAFLLEADILLGRRRLIDWIMDPFYRARGWHGMD